VDVFPWIGKLPVAEVTPQHLLQACAGSRGAVSWRRHTGRCRMRIRRCATRSGSARRRATPRDLKGALRRPMPRNFPAITEPKRFGELLRAIDHYAATPVVRAALQLAPMLLLRPGELRFAE
jgi:hypothetical protein